MTMLKRLWKDEVGASGVEYGLMVALIAAVIVVVVTTLGTNLKDTFDTVGQKVAPPAE